MNTLLRNGIGMGEHSYLSLIKKVLTLGEKRTGRNGGTLSLFGEHLRFDLTRDDTPILPLLTTKSVPLRLVLEELRWFVSGKTDNKYLMDRNVKIWDSNTKAGPLWNDNPAEDLGPIYGFQWRHFGAKYNGCKSETNTYESNGGVDQIEYVFQELKNHPESRRAIMSAWNPVDIPKMTLPPCHIMSQFWVGQNGLSCHLYQRSADIGLGVPFNIASYSLLTHAFAKSLDLRPNQLVMSFGDSHIYQCHTEGLEEQIKREPYEFPVINIPNGNHPIEILLNEKDPITVSEYKHHPIIRLPMIA
jgi:thymidylate synthase